MVKHPETISLLAPGPRNQMYKGLQETNNVWAVLMILNELTHISPNPCPRKRHKLLEMHITECNFNHL